MNEQWTPMEEYQVIEAEGVIVSRFSGQVVRLTSAKNDGVFRLPGNVQLFVLADQPIDDGRREALAAYAHAAWSGWMEYQFSKAPLNEDGTWTMPAELVARWQRQMATAYADLPEEEKASDREEADKILAIANA